jgi:hypothetical protein
MQYSKINVIDRQIIVDKREGIFINSFLIKKEIPRIFDFNEETIIKNIVYGAVLHNPGIESIDFHNWLGYLFAYSVEDGLCMLSITDIHVTATMVSGGLTFTPFAAIVESDRELIVTETEGLSAFLRYNDMDIITNILNRDGIYAIREVEKQKDLIDSFNWKQRIDEAHLVELALLIK